jgi:hypothetical protein
MAALRLKDLRTALPVVRMKVDFDRGDKGKHDSGPENGPAILRPVRQELQRVLGITVTVHSIHCCHDAALLPAFWN